MRVGEVDPVEDLLAEMSAPTRIAVFDGVDVVLERNDHLLAGCTVPGMGSSPVGSTESPDAGPETTLCAVLTCPFMGCRKTLVDLVSPTMYEPLSPGRAC